MVIVQPFSAVFGNYGVGVHILDYHCRLASPTCQHSLFFRSDRMLSSIMNGRDNVSHAVLQTSHPATITRLTDFLDLKVESQWIQPRMPDACVFNGCCHIHVHTLPQWTREEWGQPRTKDMLFSDRFTPTKDTSSWHMLYYPQGDNNGREETKDSKRTRNSHTNTRRIRTESKKGNKPRQIKLSQPEEVTPQTSPDHHPCGYNAKNTHLGSPEDV